MKSSRAGEKTPLLTGESVNNKSQSKSGYIQEEDRERLKTNSCCGSLLYYLSAVTVEPAIFLHSLSYGVESVLKTNMVVDKACMIQLNYSQEVCDHLDSGDYDQEQDSVQRIVANYSMYSMWIELLPSVFVMVLLGAWSDTRGRRLPLLLPSVGFTLKALGLALNAYFWPLQPYFILLTYIPYGLTGGMTTLYMAAYAYVGEDSGQHMRTTRLSVAGIMMHVSMPLGSGMGVFLFSRGGYVTVFGAEFILSLVSVIYILARISDGPPRVRVRDPELRRKNSGLLMSRMRQTFTVLFKKRKKKRGREQLLWHVGCISLYISTLGTMTFTFLYTRKMFQWTYRDYNLWIMLNSPISFVASCVLLPLLSYYLKVEDAILGFIGSAAHTFYGVLVGTAPFPWVMYLALAVCFGSGFVFTASRSAISKLVETDELGAVFSLVGIGEALVPVVTSLVYTAVYNRTLDVYPGTVFLITAGTTLITCVVYTYLATSFERQEARNQEANECHI